jgi:hypothetical protein
MTGVTRRIQAAVAARPDLLPKYTELQLEKARLEARQIVIEDQLEAVTAQMARIETGAYLDSLGVKRFRL